MCSFLSPNLCSYHETCERSREDEQQVVACVELGTHTQELSAWRRSFNQTLIIDPAASTQRVFPAVGGLPPIPGFPRSLISLILDG